MTEPATDMIHQAAIISTLAETHYAYCNAKLQPHSLSLRVQQLYSCSEKFTGSASKVYSMYSAHIDNFRRPKLLCIQQG